MDKPKSLLGDSNGEDDQTEATALASVGKNLCCAFPGWPTRFWLFTAIWIAVLIIVILTTDSSLAAWVGQHVPMRRVMWAFNILKAPGNFLFTLVVAGTLVIWHPLRWRAAAFVCLSGIFSGTLCAVLKWGFGRTRPLEGIPALHLQPFRGGIIGLFHGDNLSFPSGHACLVFSTAMSLSVLIPRWWIAFFAGAIIVGTERVLQASHYLGDVIAGAGLGVFSTCILWWIFDVATQKGADRSKPYCKTE
jgi:membrane-associated phospholipid phosphatase